MAARRAKFGNRAASIHPFGALSDSVGNSSRMSMITGGRLGLAAVAAGVPVALAWSSSSEAQEATTRAATRTARGRTSRAIRRGTGAQIRDSAGGERVFERARPLEPPHEHAALDLVAHGLEHLHPGVALGIGLDELPVGQLVVGSLKHVLHRLLVGRALLAVAPVLVGELPSLERVLLPALEPLQLLLGGDVQP